MTTNHHRLEPIKTLEKIHKDQYIVYALKADNNYIVLGHGKKNRAKVIFDDINTITYSHLKSFKVRLYHLFTKSKYERLIILCEDKKSAQKIEKELHSDTRYEGSNTNELVIDFTIALSKIWKDFPQVKLLLKIALNSSHSGLNDLRKWYVKGLIDPKDAGQIKKMLELEKLKGWK
tara:strand:+ start:132 stop:659 length:528 start_codon:yes stop_codon:yes gene_type:complete